MVAGLLRYGFAEETQRIATAELEAAGYSEGKLPELFCGFSREDEVAEPMPYPTACTLQAWAANPPIQLTTSLMRHEAHISLGGLWMEPALPESFGSLPIASAPSGAEPVNIKATGAAAFVRGLFAGMTLRCGTRP